MAVEGGADWAFERFLEDYNKQKEQLKAKKPKEVYNSIGGDRKVLKGRLGNNIFQVNPTTLTLGGGKNWTEVASAGLSVPMMQLGCGMSNTFSFELYVNEWMFGKKVNADAFVSEMYKCRGSSTPIKFVLGNLVKNVIVNECEILVQSFNPDMTFREVTMNVTLTTIYG